MRRRHRVHGCATLCQQRPAKSMENGQIGQHRNLLADLQKNSYSWYVPKERRKESLAILTCA